MEERYGDKIVITSKNTGFTLISFRETHLNILNQAWYNKKDSDPEAERRRIIGTSAEILRQDIRTEICETDFYPPSTSLFDDLNKSIPDSLMFFVEELLLKNKKGKSEPLKRICTTVCHIIMAALRPRSFRSPLQLGLTVYFHRQYASQRLVDILSCMGICASYKEALLYEASSLFHPQPAISPPEEGCFVQYVCDNADHNVATLDGLNTFHAMGIIKIIAPHDKMADDQKMFRLPKMPTENVMANAARIPLKVYDNHGVQGLKRIILKKLDCDEMKTTSMLRNSDVLWMYAKWKNLSDIPGWSGFMENLTKEEAYTKSRILFLPFINQPASSYSTIYTTLDYILHDGNKHGHTTCVVTFDQPRLRIRKKDPLSFL